MSQTEDGMVTKEEIVSYVDQMEIKKTNIGGFDKIDVYIHIQGLIKMYGIYTEQQLRKQKQMLEDQREEIEAFKAGKKAAEEKLAIQAELVRNQEEEIGFGMVKILRWVRNRLGQTEIPCIRECGMTGMAIKDCLGIKNII